MYHKVLLLFYDKLNLTDLPCDKEKYFLYDSIINDASVFVDLCFKLIIILFIVSSKKSKSVL